MELINGSCATWEYIKCHWTVHSKVVNFMSAMAGFNVNLSHKSESPEQGASSEECPD